MTNANLEDQIPDPPEAPPWHGSSEAMAWEDGWAAGYLAAISQTSIDQLRFASISIDPMFPRQVAVKLNEATIWLHDPAQLTAYLNGADCCCMNLTTDKNKCPVHFP